MSGYTVTKDKDDAPRRMLMVEKVNAYDSEVK
jgi:hypothetical protein